MKLLVYILALPGVAAVLAAGIAVAGFPVMLALGVLASVFGVPSLAVGYLAAVQVALAIWLAGYALPGRNPVKVKR